MLKQVDTQLIPLMESFYTIQGEGFHQGKAAVFVRLAGCDVGCVWCDVKESWEAEEYPRYSPEKIVRDTLKHKTEIVVVTGGEPLMYNLDALTSEFRSHGKQTHVETSGTSPLSGYWDWICFSPKKFKAPLEEYYEKSDELKVVIYHKSDLKWAEEHAAKMNDKAKLFLQPEWSKAEEMMPLIIDYIKENPHWEISLQIHKFMNIP